MSIAKHNLPLFPAFKKLDMTDKHTVKEFIKNHPPYSDYNFVSLYSYNTKEKIEISYLHGNLVVKFQDYLTNEYFYSFIGNKRLEETIHHLLEHAEKSKLLPVLKLIPEHNIKEEKHIHSKFKIEEDHDNFDYILSVEELSEMKGNKYRGRRNFIKRFVNHNPHHLIKKLDINSNNVKKELENLFYHWEQQMGKTRKETENELKAILRLLNSSHEFDLHAIGIYINGRLAGFSIEEVVHDNHGIIHFEKADTNYIGIYQFLKQQTALHFKNLGVTHINYEQDLGIEGLRRAKRSYNPVTYLKKYAISRK